MSSQRNQRTLNTMIESDEPDVSGIIVCGVCKNVVNTLPVIRAAFEELVAKSGMSCWAVFYENDSTDGTPDELSKWAEEMPNQVQVVCEKFTPEKELARGVARTFDNKPCRMEQIAYARNRLLGIMESDTGPRSNAKYVIMMDMDNPVPFPVNAILRCIARDPDGFDALVCNGLNPMGYMYDFYAYRDAQFPFGPEIIREAFWSGQHQHQVQTAMHNKTMFCNRIMQKNPALLPYIPIVSGFNGLCIFRKEAIKGARYSATPTPEMNAEYKLLNCIPPLAKNAKTHVDGATVGMYMFPKDNHDHANDKGIFYFHNSGYNFPVVCEHVPFFAAMRANNHRRIYLCTDLVWNWI